LVGVKPSASRSRVRAGVQLLVDLIRDLVAKYKVFV
jgi:hypothetical protein